MVAVSCRVGQYQPGPVRLIAATRQWRILVHVTEASMVSVGFVLVGWVVMLRGTDR